MNRFQLHGQNSTQRDSSYLNIQNKNSPPLELGINDSRLDSPSKFESRPGLAEMCVLMKNHFLRLRQLLLQTDIVEI